ncbi:MAG: carboxymuconolactone decarboxylase family protein [Betaproteobacteria bacterium]|nr:carboxymuconolactone decarboxylase family protein [Betaproteobacteria bacterium]
MARIEPLSLEVSPELKEAFEQYRRSLGFVPNSVLIMQRRPKLVKALAGLAAAVWDPASTVDLGFKRLVAHVASRAHGCRYCMAHTAGSALKLGVSEDKLAKVWEYRSSPLYSEAERVALDYALSAAAVPNDVTDELFGEMRRHWDDDQIVEITGVIALFGFMNRWNDSMATPLEEEPEEVGGKFLAGRGWSVGKHRA